MRKRYVYPTDQIFHLWANQTQDEARNPSRNVSFVGRTLSSYAQPIAYLGDGYALVSNHDWSVTTRRAQHRAWGAVNRHTHPRVWQVPTIPSRYRDDWENVHRDALRMFRDDFAKAFRMATKSGHKVNRGWRADRVERVVSDWRAYCDQFSLEMDALPPDYDAALAKARREAEQASAEREAVQRARDARRAARNAELRDAWLAGASNGYHTPGYHPALRVRGECLETSAGASVPLPDAVRLFKLAQGVRARGAAWFPAEPVRCGFYSLVGISAEGDLSIGCHRLAWSDMERVAQDVGVLA